MTKGLRRAPPQAWASFSFGPASPRSRSPCCRTPCSGCQTPIGRRAGARGRASWRARHFGDANWASSIASNAAASGFRVGDWTTATRAHEEWRPRGGPDIVEGGTLDAVVRGLRGEPAESRIDDLAEKARTLTDPQV